MEVIQRVKITHLFLVCVKSVPRCHFKLAYVVLQMAIKKVFESHFKNDGIGRFNHESHF